jgi:hypothetical protein
METEKAIVKAGESRLPKFVEDSYESIEKMNAFANMLLESKLLPIHFYEKGPDGKTDYSRGKTASVVAVLLQGYQLQLPPLMATQHIIPVNGLLSIKGDMAKSLIFNSGKLKPGSWTEEETGSLEGGDFSVKITATRADNGTTISRSFSIMQAKRAGLWVSEQQVAGQDGWRHKQSAWYKYPARMIGYRALGFIARDLFPDVMNGIYTTEEALDLPRETAEVIETEAGTKIIIPDKQHAQDRSKKLTERVADKVQPDKFAPVQTEKEVIQEATVVAEEQPPREESPFIPSKGSVEYMDGEKIRVDGKPVTTEEEEAPPSEDGPWTLAQMEKMDTKVLLAKVNSDTDMMEACEMIGSKNTNKKLREIIFAWQEGTLAEHVVPYLSQDEAPQQDAPPPAENKPDEVPLKPRQNKVGVVNKYGLDIPEVEVGQLRDFSDVKRLFNQFVSITPKVDNPRYIELSTKLGFIEKYPDREIFIKSASKEALNLLLNNN